MFFLSFRSSLACIGIWNLLGVWNRKSYRIGIGWASFDRFDKEVGMGNIRSLFRSRRIYRGRRGGWFCLGHIVCNCFKNLYRLCSWNCILNNRFEWLFHNTRGGNYILGRLKIFIIRDILDNFQGNLNNFCIFCHIFCIRNCLGNILQYNLKNK